MGQRDWKKAKSYGGRIAVDLTQQDQKKAESLEGIEFSWNIYITLESKKKTKQK